MAGSRRTDPGARRAALRRTLGAWVMLAAVALTAVLIWMGMNDAVPGWFLGIATVL